MKQKWDERYSDIEFAYGKEPNLFFKEWIQQFKPGSILMPADGEGRNGVYAATLGWKVTSFDLSNEGQTKALQLAKEKNVSLEYLVNDFENLEFAKESFDAIGLIYAHFSGEQKSRYHQKLNEYLKPGGVIIFEAFGKAHLPLRQMNPKVGGPNHLSELYSLDEIQTDFKNYENLYLKEELIELNEGKYHIGKGAVVRFVGRKNEGL